MFLAKTVLVCAKNLIIQLHFLCIVNELVDDAVPIYTCATDQLGSSNNR